MTKGLLIVCAWTACATPSAGRNVEAAEVAAVSVGAVEEPSHLTEGEFRHVAQILHDGTPEELTSLSAELFGWSVEDGRAEEESIQEYTYLRSALGRWLEEQRAAWGPKCATAEAGPECVWAGLITQPDRLGCESLCCSAHYDEMPDNMIFLTRVCFVPKPDGTRELRHLAFEAQ